MQLDRYLKISKHCGQIGMLTATKQLDVIHLSEKQATPFSCRIFSFTMLLPNFYPVYLQHSSFKQGLFFKVSILLKKNFIIIKVKSLDQDEDLCSFSPDMTPNSGSLQWNVRGNKTPNF